MISLNRQHVVGSSSLYDSTSGFHLRVQCIKADQTVHKIQALEHRPSHRNLVGLVHRHRLASQIIEAWDGGGIQEHFSTATFGGFPVNSHHFIFGHRSANLLLEGQNRSFNRSGIYRF